VNEAEGMSGMSTVLITGASRGIGAEVATALLKSGHRVIASMRGTDGRNAESAAALRDAGGFVVDLDVTDEASVERGVGAGLAEYGTVDVLVNNAGYGVFGAMESTTPDDLARQIDVNVLGVQRVMRAVLPTMREHRRGLIVQLSSGMGRYAMPARGPYSVSKWALEAMSDTYRIELTQFGIEVVVLELGPFRSSFQEMHVETTDQARQSAYPNMVNEAEHDARHRDGWGRRADPASVVQAIEDLVSWSDGARPWRVALHPLRELLDPYNDQLEALQRRVLSSRADPSFLPPA
jgi:NAD(P)-dependent dehydrogenase (short-subunit alcohol dehydrogenase family)